MKGCEYVVYVDESGDHGLDNIDKDYPVFVLSFCCFKIDDYIKEAVPLIQELKFKYFGHDQIIFHEQKIRKQKGDFSFLRRNRALREEFLEDINKLVSEIKVDIFAMVIDKPRLKAKYKSPYNPYNIGMQFGMEIIYKHLLYNGQKGKKVNFIFEKRGKKEDDELELEFRRIYDGVSFGWKKFTFNQMDYDIVFADKKSNSSGLQLADLTARPIGLKHIRPSQANRAFDIIDSKIKRRKVFP